MGGASRLILRRHAAQQRTRGCPPDFFRRGVSRARRCPPTQRERTRPQREGAVVSGPSLRRGPHVSARLERPIPRNAGGSNARRPRRFSTIAMACTESTITSRRKRSISLRKPRPFSRYVPNLRKPDPRGLGEFIACGCVLENRTFFEGIQVLPPGSAGFFVMAHSKRRALISNEGEWEEQSPLEP